MRALSPEDFEVAANKTGTVLMDTSDPQTIKQGFIRNSINISIYGNYAPGVGTLIPDIKQPILIIADKGREEEIITRLARVGYDNTIGFLSGGFPEWSARSKEVDTIASITAEELADLVAKNADTKILD